MLCRVLVYRLGEETQERSALRRTGGSSRAPTAFDRRRRPKSKDAFFSLAPVTLSPALSPRRSISCDSLEVQRSREERRQTERGRGRHERRRLFRSTTAFDRRRLNLVTPTFVVVSPPCFLHEPLVSAREPPGDALVYHNRGRQEEKEEKRVRGTSPISKLSFALPAIIARSRRREKTRRTPFLLLTSPSLPPPFPLQLPPTTTATLSLSLHHGLRQGHQVVALLLAVPGQVPPPPRGEDRLQGEAASGDAGQEQVRDGGWSRFDRSVELRGSRGSRGALGVQGRGEFPVSLLLMCFVSSCGQRSYPRRGREWRIVSPSCFFRPRQRSRRPLLQLPLLRPPPPPPPPKQVQHPQVPPRRPLHLQGHRLPDRLLDAGGRRRDVLRLRARAPALRPESGFD